MELKEETEVTKKELLFRELLEYLNDTNIVKKEEYKYIGTGNPISNILIIGKETSVSVDSEQYKTETLDNFNFWYRKYNTNDFSSNTNEHSPLYPYKGQLLKKDNGKGNNGTSVTWMNYQKILNYICNTPENNKINFHEKSFITEVNSTPSKKTDNANTYSIDFRKKHILTSNFFQSFKVVIISGVGYFEVSDKKNEIESIFGVTFSEEKNAGGKPKQPYWIHWNDDKTKLVINTYQLSINISNELLKEIAEIIKESKLVRNA